MAPNHLIEHYIPSLTEKKKKPSQSFVSFYEQEKNVFYIPQMIGIESCFLISGL